jgi:pimeloyl-ACP methyl ester carboxylesterase
MKKANINGTVLEYEIKGSGEPLLLISTGPIADSFVPFLSEKSLIERYRMIAYHQRGVAGSPRGPDSKPVSFEQHAADAAALLRHLDVPRAHVAGHGTPIALQLAVDHPGVVHTLVLLETPLLSVPSAGAFFEKVRPALEAYRAGDGEEAMAKFLSVVSSLDWETCRAVIQKHVPGGIAQAMKDADNFFGSYLPALNAWQFGPVQAATIARPVLAVLGTETQRLFVEGHELLRTWFPRLEDCKIEGVGHLLHMQRPERVLSGVAAWLARHPMRGGVGTPVKCDRAHESLVQEDGGEK